MESPCEFCEKARINPVHPFFSPACLWCGARLIARLRDLAAIRPRGEIKARQETVLTDWEKYGHSRAQMLALSKGPLPLSPSGPASNSPPSDNRTPAKRR